MTSPDLRVVQMEETWLDLSIVVDYAKGMSYRLAWQELLSCELLYSPALDIDIEHLYSTVLHHTDHNRQAKSALWST